jgi:anti-anti-sigma factor
VTDIKIDHVDGHTAILHPGPELDTHHAPALRTALQRLAHNGTTLTVIDMTDVEHIDPAGLGCLWMAGLRAHHNHTDLRLAAANDHIRKTMRAARFRLPVWDTVNDAINDTTTSTKGA